MFHDEWCHNLVTPGIHISLTRYPREYLLKSWIACNEMDTTVEKCIDKVEEFEGIWCNEMDTQVEKCIEKVDEIWGDWMWRDGYTSRELYRRWSGGPTDCPRWHPHLRDAVFVASCEHDVQCLICFSSAYVMQICLVFLICRRYSVFVKARYL